MAGKSPRALVPASQGRVYPVGAVKMPEEQAEWGQEKQEGSVSTKWEKAPRRISARLGRVPAMCRTQVSMGTY